MRPRSKTPLNRRYFHTKPKKDNKDMLILKKKIDSINQKKYEKMLDKKEKRRIWHNR